VREALAARRRALLKPIYGFGGRGIAFLAPAGEGVSVNGATASAGEFDAAVGRLDDYLLTDFVAQHDYAERIHPHTTNTVRLLTLWDDERGEPYLAAACHRFGTARSGRFDNFHGGHGGLSVAIDRETGVLGNAVTLVDGAVVRRPDHPDTGEAIAGIAVPGWNAVVGAVLAAARALPFAPAIGWDLVVTADGVSCLEGNAPPGTYVWQVHEPLLADPRNRRFFEHRGALRGPRAGR
jgi:hypothetical protein